MSDTLIRNCGRIVSGILSDPLLDADSIRILEDKVVEIGIDLVAGPSSNVIDAAGGTVIPGLIDSHSHPVVGDFTPRQSSVGWTQRALHGGVTSLISAGETHWPGRTKDGAEAVAIAQAAFLTSRLRLPGAARVFGGALLLDRGVTKDDIANLHDVGLRALGEIGLGSEKNMDTVAELVDFAKALNWVVPLHFGGASVPGSSVIDLEVALRLRPTVISHANGGPTSRPFREIEYLVEHTDAAIEVVFAGNSRIATQTTQLLFERNELERLQLGTDTPSGTGVVPLAMLRLITEIASTTDVSVETLICAATGGTARRYGHTALGSIEVGMRADLVILSAPLGGGDRSAFESMKYGNVPAVAGVFIDGGIAVDRSNVTPPPLAAVTLSSNFTSPRLNI